MIKRLTDTGYMKRMNVMTLAEKKDYAERIGRWMQEQAPLISGKTDEQQAHLSNIIQCSMNWNDAECAAWDDGIRLLTALMGTADTWLPEMMYIKAAKRTIRKLIKTLSEVKVATPIARSDVQDVSGKQNEPVKQEQPTRTAGPVQPTEKKKPGRPKKEEQGIRMQAGAAKEALMTAVQKPKHIDQYAYLLPGKTQERAALVKGLLQQMDVARENARLLMNDPKSSPADRARWATLSTKCDDELKKIYKELDEEWDKLAKSGRVTIDALGNVRVQQSPIPTSSEEEEKTVLPRLQSRLCSKESKNGQSSMVNEQKDPNKRRQLRKWLVDTRRGNGDTRPEYVKKWKENFAAYLAIEGDAAYEDERIKAAAVHYGISLEETKP